MKNLLFYAILAAVAMTVIASACTVENRRVAREGTDPEPRCRYVGTLPAADGPGIMYDLTLNGPVGDTSGEGDFALTMTYLEAENGRDAAFDSRGRWTTVRGVPGDPSAVVCRLVRAGAKPDTMNFLYLDNTLELLGADLQRARSGLNYTLILAE